MPCPHLWQAPAAEALITALSKPGDLVAVPGPASGVLVFLAAAAAAGRRALGLAATPGCPGDLAALPDCGLSPEQRQPARVEPGGPAALLAGSCPDAGKAALVITAACPTPGCYPPDPADPAGDAAGGDDCLHAACARLLAPGGLLVVLTRAARHAAYPAGLIARVRGEGLSYSQHIIALHARIAGSRLAATAPAPAPAPARAGEPDPGRHLPVHTDLLVFTQGAARS